MKQHQVKFTIKPGGGISYEVLNGEGESCTLATRELDLHLSQVGKVVDEGKKPEYFDSTPNTSVFNDLN